MRTLPAFLSAGSRFLLAGVLLALILAPARPQPPGHAARARLIGAARGRAAGPRRRRRHARRDTDRLEHRRDDRRLGAAAGDPPADARARAGRARDAAQRPRRARRARARRRSRAATAPSSAVGLALDARRDVSWSLGSFFAHRLPLPRDGFVATTWQMLSAGVFLLLLGVATGELGDDGPGRLHASSRSRPGSTSPSSARWSPSPPTPGCSGTRRSRRSSRTST